jgi:hypothetical protein
MEDMKMDAVIAKVRKLLAMAAGNANEHEAAIAAMKAQQLLEAYNLDMAIINRATSEHAPRKDEKKSGGLYKWQRDLWYAVAVLNFCRYYYHRGLYAGSSYEHQLIGSHANVIGAEIMARYLESTIERLARNWVAENRPGRSIFIKEAIAYREGLASRLSERLWSKRYEQQEADRKTREAERARNRANGLDTENALVLQDVINTEEDLNMDHICGWPAGTSAKRRAEREREQERASRAAAELLKIQDAWDAAHPEEAAKRKAQEEAEAQRRSDKYWNKTYRERKATPEEERRRLASFGEGYREGANVSLDKQVDAKVARKLN